MTDVSRNTPKADEEDDNNNDDDVLAITICAMND